MATTRIEQLSGTIRVYRHNVLYRWWKDRPFILTDEQKKLLEEAAELRAKEMIAQEYCGGELNYETPTLSIRGWWQICRT